MAEDSSSSATGGLIYALIVGSITTAVVVLIFDFLRRKLPAIFDYRRLCHQRGQPKDYLGNSMGVAEPPPSKLFAWIIPVIKHDIEDMIPTHGLDTVMFLRFIRSQIYLFAALTVVCILVLVPVYGTASNKNLGEMDPLKTKGLDVVSLGNVNEDDKWRFWITFLWDIVVAFAVYAVMYKEYASYTRHRRKYRSDDNPANYAIVVQDIPEENQNEESIRAYWERLFPGEVAKVSYVYDAKKLIKKKTRFWKAVTKRERAEWEQEFNPKLNKEAPHHKPGVCSCCVPNREKVNSIEYWRDQQDHYRSKITRYQHEKDPQHLPPTGAAIVTFRNKRAATAAAQICSGRRENEWRVEQAAEPDAVNYPKLAISGKQAPIRFIITFSSILALTIFWFAIVAAVQALANLQSIAELKINGNTPFSFLNVVKDWPPLISSFIEGFLPPVLLTVFVKLVPLYIRLLVGISRVHSLGRRDVLVRNYFFNFLVFSNFLFVVISGSFLQKIAIIIKEPGQIVSLLSNSIPGQGIFIMTFILLKALSENSKELLQIGRVVIRLLFRQFLAKTPRELRNVDEKSCAFPFFKHYAYAQLMALLGIIYSSIQPVITVVCLIYFTVLYCVSKYNLTYSLVQPYHDGGSMFPGAFVSVLIGLFLHQLTMIGLMSLKKQKAQGVLEIILTVGSAIYMWYCFKRFREISKHGSLVELVERQEQDKALDKIPEDFPEKYVHPGMEPLPEPVENWNGIGDNRPKDEMKLADDLEDGRRSDEGYGSTARA